MVIIHSYILYYYREIVMKKMIFSIYVLIIFVLLCSTYVYMQEHKTSKLFEKTIYPELLIDSYKGDKNENYILYEPSAITTDSKSNLYVVNFRINQISKFNDKGKFVKKWGSAGAAPGEFQFTGPGDALTVGSDGFLYIVDRGQARIQKFNLEGKYLDGFNVKWGDWPDSIVIAQKRKIYLSVPPVNNLKKKYTIHLYEKTTNGYEFVKGFSDSPVWLNSEDITQKESMTVSYSAMSFLTCDSNNNIYQVFRYLPIIRKFNPSGEMIWQKTIDIRTLSRMKGNHITYYEKELEPQKIDRKNISVFAKKIFALGIAFSKQNERIYVFHTQKYTILELNLDGKLLGAYYPCDILLASDEDSKNLTTTGKFWSYFNFTLNMETNKAFFIGLNTGELWVSKL